MCLPTDQMKAVFKLHRFTHTILCILRTFSFKVVKSISLVKNRKMYEHVLNSPNPVFQLDT